MAKINLREFYPFYCVDEYIEVTEEVSEMLKQSERSEEAQRKKVIRYKAYFSLDREDGIERALLSRVYTPEEIEADPALGMVQLFYFPAKTENAKYVVVVPGNGGNTTAELNEGASIANQLHDLGYAVFVLRYRSFLNASDNAPLYDIANAVKYLTKNAEQFGVQRENYALMGFSSGGHIVGLIGSDNERFGYKAFGIPQPAALLLGYPINDFYEVKPLYHIAIDPLMIGWRYYWTNISDVVNKNYTPTFFWYGKHDYYMECMNYEKQGPLLEKTLKESGATYQCVVYEDAPHAIGPGRHTDADGWVKLATEFWEEQCK